jgi:two-component system OmpR family sensor kinase
MSLLVDDLLLLARLDQGRPLERTPVDLSRIVADAVEAARVINREQPVTVEMEDAVVVHGDAARLRQIVDNLLHNAVVHTPPGTPVRVSVKRKGPLAEIRVADDGPGLDAEKAARVFDRFYRGSEARTGEGVGLGLSIVAALAAAHEGRASVEAVPGAGAVFSVEIPAAEPEAAMHLTREAEAPEANEHLAPSVRR